MFDSRHRAGQALAYINLSVDRDESRRCETDVRQPWPGRRAPQDLTFPSRGWNRTGAAEIIDRRSGKREKDPARRGTTEVVPLLTAVSRAHVRSTLGRDCF